MKFTKFIVFHFLYEIVYLRKKKTKSHDICFFGELLLKKYANPQLGIVSSTKYRKKYNLKFLWDTNNKKTLKLVTTIIIIILW